ncbi:MAG: hypothetical protein Q9181_002054 [Wetmoreana brouardii]
MSLKKLLLRVDPGNKSGPHRSPEYGEHVGKPSYFRTDTDIITRHLKVSSEGLRKWIEDFVRLGKLELLEAEDSSEVARALQNLGRKHRTNKDQQSQELVYELVEVVRKAYIAGSIPSAASVPLHLLSYYKESGHFSQGIEFWNWLSKADDALLHPVFVGAAIELLAVYGAGIRYCEDIYQRTLDQQRNISTPYHFTPGAILPDRSKAVTIKGTSFILLQGILSARILYGRWQSSYLTLDTAFRLRPTQIVPRILDLFVHERPLPEALDVFFMYCRGGNVVPGRTLMAILNSLKGLVDPTSAYTARIQAIRTMFIVIEAHVGSAGLLDTRHLNLVTRMFVSVMPQCPMAMPTQSIRNTEHLTRIVLDTLTKTVGYFNTHNAAADSGTFAAITSPALSRGYPELVRMASQDMMNLGLSPNKLAAQDLLQAAGLLKDPKLLETAWTSLRNTSSSDLERSLDALSWSIMTVAARRCGLESFAGEQLQQLAPESAVQARTAVQSVEDNAVQQCLSVGQPQGSLQANDVNRFEDLCAYVCTSLDRIESVQCGKTWRDFHENPIDEETVFRWPEDADESWQRKLYDELTLEKDDGPSTSAVIEGSYDYLNAVPAVSDTGIPFEELRYLNWKTINRLLLQAEVFEKRLEASTDAAIQARRASPHQRTTTGHERPSKSRHPVTVNQLQAYQQDVENERHRKMTEEEWRTRILRLRNPDYESSVDTNTSLPP